MDARIGPGWYVISMRPQGGHAPLRRAAACVGARLVSLAPWRIVARDDDATRAALRRALQASRVVFTSPSAVRAAARLAPLRMSADARWCAVGGGTARALARVGVRDADAPARMDSDGLLALPALRDVDGRDVGLVTAPGGRDAIAPALQARGATVHRADVYDRVPVPPSPRALALLRTRPRAALAASSGEALERIVATLPPDVAAWLLDRPLAAASERIAERARALGFGDVRPARGPRPADLVAALAGR